MPVGLRLAQGPDQEIRVALAMVTTVPVTVDLLTGEIIWITPDVAAAILIIDPAYVEAGGAAFTMRLFGSGFTGASQVAVAGTNRTTTFISATALTAAILAADIAVPGVYAVTVTTGAVVLTAYLTVYAPRRAGPGRGPYLDPQFDLVADLKRDETGAVIRQLRDVGETLNRNSRN